MSSILNFQSAVFLSRYTQDTSRDLRVTEVILLSLNTIMASCSNGPSSLIEDSQEQTYSQHNELNNSDISDDDLANFGYYNSTDRIYREYDPPSLQCISIFLLTGLRSYTGEYKAQGPTLCPTEGRALRGPRALYSPV